MLFALFACLVAALCVHVLTATVICGQSALRVEERGRGSLAATDGLLADLSLRAGEEWATTPWQELEVGGVVMTGRLVERSELSEWTLAAEVAGSAPPGGTRATVERGRDGLDLPGAAIVCSCLLSNAARTTEWLVRDSDTSDEDDAFSNAYVESVEGPTEVGAGCGTRLLERKWQLDDGSRLILRRGGIGPNVRVIEASKGEMVGLPQGTDLSAPDAETLVVVLGGAVLDLRGLGEVWGVIVVDEGSVLMDGTVVHGAVCASECVDVGESGQVSLSGSLLQWARDASLVRVRLVPGSRQEGTE